MKAAADNKSGAVKEFDELFTKLQSYAEFPKSMGGQENGGKLAWFLRLNDPQLSRFGIRNLKVGDFHSLTVVGKTIGQNPKNIFGYPILNVLKNIKEPGQKELI